MGTNQLARRAGVAALHHVYDVAMFCDQLMGVASLDGADRQANKPVGLIEHIPDGGLHPRITRGGRKRIVKRSVVVDEILLRINRPEPVQIRQHLVACALHRSRDAGRLKRETELEEIPDVLHGNRVDLVALPRLHRHQAVLLQAQKRLADRLPADFIAISQILLTNFLSRHQPASENFGSKGFIYILSQQHLTHQTVFYLNSDISQMDKYAVKYGIATHKNDIYKMSINWKVESMMYKKLNAYIAGQGRPLFLIHSLLSDRDSFERLMPLLSRQYSVVVPDLPGFGASPASTQGLAETADRIADLASSFAGDDEAVIVGNGFGAFAALTAAIRHPERRFRLVLVGCGARFSDQGREAFRKMAAAATAGGLEAVVETAMNRLFAAEFQAGNPDLMENRRKAFLRMDLDVFRDACLSLAEIDLSAQVAKLVSPTLVIVGDEDQATPIAMAQDLAKTLPHGELRILEGCAHVPPLQAPEKLLALIETFLDVQIGDRVGPN